MTKQLHALLISYVLVCCCPGVALAQDPPDAGEDATDEEATQPVPKDAQRIVIERLAAQLLQDLASKHVDALDLQFIEPDAGDENGGWGVRYQWDAEKADADYGESGGRWAMRKLAYNLGLQGTYAFSDAENNEEHSTAKVSVRLERADFGAMQFIANEASEALQDCLANLPEDSDDPIEQRKNDQLEMQCWVDNGIDKVVKSSYGGYDYWLDFHGGVEGNQDYSESQTLFGLSAAYSSEPTRERSLFNLPDLPFRLLRNFGDDSSYVAPFPSVMLTVERLNADNDSERAALTTKTTYTRGSAEVAFQTIIANFGGRPLRFNVSYRYFHEFSPPDEIEAADLDQFDFWRASLRFPAHLLPLIPSENYEFFLAYTSGRLPFDQSGGQAIQLGITTNMKMLGQLLGQ